MWLEDYLQTYKGALLIVSHDRYFLDKLATSICEIEHGRLTRYKGNYTAFVALKDAEDCADILKDLGRIKYTIAHGSEQEARALDYELQQKYPAIDAMLQAADNLQATRIPLCFTTVKSGSSAKSNLQQDYWGIICDAAIKKGIKKRMEDCIDHIEYS